MQDIRIRQISKTSRLFWVANKSFGQMARDRRSIGRAIRNIQRASAQ